MNDSKSVIMFVEKASEDNFLQLQAFGRNALCQRQSTGKFKVRLIASCFVRSRKDFRDGKR